MTLFFLELWSYLQIVVVWVAFKRFAKRDVSGGLLAGSLIGLMNEFITEPFWLYHFKINIYKDIPLSVIPAWGVLLVMVTFLSEKAYKAVFKINRINPKNYRILLFDIIIGVLVGFPVETIGIKFGAWEYNYDLLQWNWGNIPVLGMPTEALIGYALFMLVFPSFVRHWQSNLRLTSFFKFKNN